MPAGGGGCLARTSGVLPILVATIFAATSFAHAAPLLGAPYGDKDGCHYAATGESSGSDAFFLLADDSLTTSTAVCSFDALRKTKAGFEGTATCESEGASGEPEKVEITKSAKGYTVAFADGTRYGPLSKCKVARP